MDKEIEKLPYWWNDDYVKSMSRRYGNLASTPYKKNNGILTGIIRNPGDGIIIVHGKWVKGNYVLLDNVSSADIDEKDNWA